MRKFFIAVPLLLFATGIYSQQLSQVSFSGGATFSYFSFRTNEDVQIRITLDGKATEWGIEVQSLRSDSYYSPKLQPYLGRVDYYPPTADSAFRGKLKSVGTCVLSYYGSHDMDTKVGKIRSVGSLVLDYYSNFGNTDFKGRLRIIGNLAVDYYSSTEDEAYRNKLKSIGNTFIKYYSSFEDKLIKGKVKSIGSVNYNWYSSFDLNRSGLKSGVYRRNINGVTYILQ